MNEGFAQTGNIENSEVYNLGVERDGCLGNTIASIVSTISGREYKLPHIYYAWRGMMIKDMTRTYIDHVRKDRDGDRTQREMALHRLDQQVFRKILTTIQSTGLALPSAIPIVEVLQESEISYKRGDFDSILGEIANGGQVAVTYETPREEDPSGETWWHIAHIGYNKEGNLVRFSDEGKPVTQATVNAINQSAEYLNGQARTWNFVVVKRID